MRFASRIDQLPVYHFAEIESEVASRLARGVKVINLGIGDPDTPTPPAICSRLKSAVDDATTHGYPTNRGTSAFRAAVAEFYRTRFGVVLDPDRQVLPVLGSKEGLSNLSLVMLQPGDAALALDPGYPVYVTGPKIAGAEVVGLPLLPDLQFQPDLDAIDDSILARARVIFIGYPHNPTGAVIEDDFFERLVAMAHEHDFLIVHDHAYADITYDGYVAPSLLKVDGAMEVAVEFYSLSKGYNMTGWRSAALVGNAEVLGAYWRLKTNIDSGMFAAVQFASVEALLGSSGIPRIMSSLYQRRRDMLVRSLRQAGLDAPSPKGTIYLWVPVPDGHSSASFASLLLEQADIVISPGAAYGPAGEGYVRFSLSTTDAELAEAVRRIEERVEL